LGTRTSRVRRWPIVCVLLLLILFLARHALGGWLGEYLVQAGPPAHADLAVVLAGDFYGNRILKGAELVREGYAPQALVSGPAGLYGFHECDLAIPFAVKADFPKSDFIAFPHNSKSTTEEIAAIVPELRKRKVHSVDLVTSDYHTRRAGRIFHAAAPDIELHVVAAPDENFRAYGWWQTREGRKVFAIEWMKTIAGWFSI